MRSSRLRDDIQIFAIDGPLKTTERFAYDNRYVYTGSVANFIEPHRPVRPGHVIWIRTCFHPMMTSSS
ncbi:hypothetical protein HZS97_22705 [Shigella flexneri]|uniref:hypothetical protein n=1 Tax=Shigella flexneri TaxID=623 RepID=UPI0025409720|nr:hypothetical protein [Shigella flexneri]UMV03436.1 hypothetical protein HZS97_22705 [Shigella flexneri]